MRAGLKAPRASPSRKAIDSAASYGDWTPSTSSSVLRGRVVPGEAAFRLEKHRVDGLRLEFAVEHQERRIVRGELGADLLAVDRGLGVGRPVRIGERRPDRTIASSGDACRTDPALLQRRVDIRRVRRRRRPRA